MAWKRLDNVTPLMYMRINPKTGQGAAFTIGSMVIPARRIWILSLAINGHLVSIPQEVSDRNFRNIKDLITAVNKIIKNWSPA